MKTIPNLPRFVVFVFDALRRDMITPVHMPHLRRFLDEGCDFPSSRCVFPSATRINAAALVCGAVPSATGVIANKFFDANVYSIGCSTPASTMTCRQPSEPTAAISSARLRWEICWQTAGASSPW
jgi:hypothetical protein